MNLWLTVLLGSFGAYAEKLAGYIVPASWLAQPTLKRIVDALPIGLLAALVAFQAFGKSQTLVVDGRAFGLLVAAIALWRGASFVVVVVLAAFLTGLGRAAGLLS